MKSPYVCLACAVALTTAAALAASSALAPVFRISTTALATAAHPSPASRNLYAVNQSFADRGSISVYDIDAGHSLVKTIKTVPDVDDVKGVAASAATGRLYVAYRTRSGVGMIYCLSIRPNVAPNKGSDDGTEIFDARTHESKGLIGSSEDMIEIDFSDGKISGVGDQYGIGRAAR